MILEPGRHRTEMPNGIVSITDFGKKKSVILNREKRRATVLELTGATPGQGSNYFGRMQAHLRTGESKSNGRIETLGNRQMDGRRVVGYRMTTPGQTTVLWGIEEPGQPVRIEFSSEMMPKTKIIMTDFEFNAELDESLFSVEVPSGYEIRSASMDRSPVEEKDLLEALRLHCELSDGAFPETLPMKAQTVQTLLKTLGVKPGSRPDEKAFKKLMQQATTLGRGLAGFPAQLPPEADAHYAGKGVKLGSSETPIFWYRPATDKTYRLVYADLSVREANTPPSVPNAQSLRGPSE
jgi:outer membrane lipoprotein-sorting protein